MRIHHFIKALTQRFQKIEQKKEIAAWLDRMEIEHYRIRPDLSVDVNGSVDLREKNLISIPVQFGVVAKDFNINHNSLTSLKGCPHTVGKHFNCSHNQLTSLEFGPQHLGSYEIFYNYECSYNQIQSLKHAPKNFKGNFWCSFNQICSLEGVESCDFSAFYCDGNRIENLDFLPSSVTNAFYCDGNPLLGEAQNKTNFSEILKIKDDIQKIKEEKSQLDDLIFSTSSKKSTQTHKI